MPTESEPIHERSSMLARRFWSAHALVIVVIAGCLAGSYWQFHVWHVNRQVAQRTLTDQPPIALTSLFQPGQPYPNDALGRPVTLAGSWLPDSTIYVANQPSPLNSDNGYWVVTSVRLADGAIPVLRGWSARQAASPVNGPVSIQGWLEPSDDTDPAQVQTDPPTYGSLSIAALTQTARVPLYGGYITVGKGAPGTDGLVVTGPTVTEGIGASTGLLNFMYGVQWLLFVLMAIYLWWRWCHGWADERREVEEPKVAGRLNDAE